MTAPEEDILNQQPGGGRPRVSEGPATAAAEGNGAARQFYADAHYEPAGSTTVPPRYYTPPVRQPKQPRIEAPEKPGGKRFGLVSVISLCLICSLVGGIIGAVTLYAISERRMARIENALADSVGADAESEEAIFAPEQRQNTAAESSGILPAANVCELTYLGVWLDERYNAVAAQYYNMPLGAYVTRVEPGSAADRAGLVCGDIIIGIDSQTVESSSDLRTAMGRYGVGDSARLVLYRAGESVTVTVSFEETAPRN